jgi:putative tricarboxylic transport membrane protein
LERGEEADRPLLFRPAGNFAGVAQRATFGDHFMKNLPLRRDHMLRPFAVLALVVVTLSGYPAAAQDNWPSKPITVIVPFGAGGNTDSLARIYSARLSARLGQQFVIENRVGAGSIIGITSLAKAAPDGYTIGIGTSAGLAINPAIMKENLGYNAEKDFAYLHLMAIQPNLLVVHPSVPARSLPDFIAWVKANPDQAYATSGNGSSQHLCGEMLIQAAGIKMNAVAYRRTSRCRISSAARLESLAITSHPPGNRSRLGKSVHSP